jgi:hypothetical protein
MGSTKQIGIALLGAVLAMALLAGCGGSDSASGDSDSEVSTEFIQRGDGGSRFARFGEESSAAEREAASRVLDESLDARSARNFKAQCATLTAGRVKSIEAKGNQLGIKGGCAESLEAEAEVAPQSVLNNNMTGPIDVLRIEDDQAYALYHGTKGKDYAMPMKKEGGQWKVNAVVTTEVP